MHLQNADVQNVLRNTVNISLHLTLTHSGARGDFFVRHDNQSAAVRIMRILFLTVKYVHTKKWIYNTLKHV